MFLSNYMYIIALMIRDIEFNISTQSRGAEKNLDLPYYIVKKKKGSFANGIWNNEALSTNFYCDVYILMVWKLAHGRQLHQWKHTLYIRILYLAFISHIYIYIYLNRSKFINMYLYTHFELVHQGALVYQFYYCRAYFWLVVISCCLFFSVEFIYLFSYYLIQTIVQ